MNNYPSLMRFYAWQSLEPHITDNFSLTPGVRVITRIGNKGTIQATDDYHLTSICILWDKEPAGYGELNCGIRIISPLDELAIEAE